MLAKTSGAISAVDMFRCFFFFFVFGFGDWECSDSRPLSRGYKASGCGAVSVGRSLSCLRRSATPLQCACACSQDSVPDPAAGLVVRDGGDCAIGLSGGVVVRFAGGLTMGLSTIALIDPNPSPSM